MFGKAIVFITSEDQGDKRLLVLGHPNAGIQIPKGTIDENESPLQAALREGSEETGLTDLVCSSHIITENLSLKEDQRYIVSETSVYSRPDKRSFDWAHLRRGIRVNVRQKNKNYTQIEYLEYEDISVRKTISYQIIGWVPNEKISREYIRSYYHLTTKTEKENWKNFDDNHEFELHWIDIEGTSKLLDSHEIWVDEIFIPYIKKISEK
ncbi:MAG: NUDIX domain-containing protein [Clostridiales bacterium]|nr:NUDIX domain-containing protein [Clostridiales bacterium]